LEDTDSVLKRSAKICQRCFVKQMLGPFVTEFALDLAGQHATPVQRGCHSRFLDRI
jgi:hypothetical protein